MRDEWDRLWRQLCESRKDCEPVTFTCPVCKDVQFVPGPIRYRNGMHYETAKACGCLELLRAVKKVEAEDNFPEAKRPRNYRQLPEEPV